MCVFAIFSQLAAAFRHSSSHNFSNWNVFQTLVIGVTTPLQKYCRKRMRCDWFHVSNKHFTSYICSKLNENFFVCFLFYTYSSIFVTSTSLFQHIKISLYYYFHVFDVMSFYSWYIDEHRDPLLNLYTSLHRKRMFRF